MLLQRQGIENSNLAVPVNNIMHKYTVILHKFQALWLNQLVVIL